MNFSFSTFIFEIINFLVLAYILQRFLYRPLHDMIDRRREAIARAQEEAAEARRQAEELQQQLAAKLAGADEQRRQVLARAHDEAEEQRRRLLAHADDEARDRIADAERAIELEKRDARDALQAELLHDALEVTERLLAEVSSSTVQEQLVERLVSTLDALPVQERKQLTESWKPGDRAVLESASVLGRSEVERIEKAASNIVGRPVDLSLQTDPDLIGGVRLRLDGHLWDASLAGSLE